MTRSHGLLTAGIVTAGLLMGIAAWWRGWERLPASILEASGVIEATEVQLSFKVSGRLIERPVDDGTHVDPDTLIGRLESLDLAAQVEQLLGSLRATEAQMPLLRTDIALQEELTATAVAQARAALVARQEQVAELRHGARPQELQIAMAKVREAKATRDNAEADFKRADELFRRELIAAQARDAARTALDVASAQYGGALENLEMVKEGPRQEEIRQAEAAVRQAEAALLQAQTGRLVIVQKRQQLAALEAQISRDRGALGVAEAQLGYTVLRSPQAGVVLRKHVEPGEIIAAGTPVVTLADLRNTWVKIYIPEPQLGRIKLGQAAEVRTDSYPGRAYRGTVSFVSSEAEFTPKIIQTPEERVKLVFAVKIAVDNPNQELKPGMPADVRVATQ
jgi:HlyD family secretion protein